MERSDFDTLYGRHAAYARRVLRRCGVAKADLDDAVQDAFVTIHRLLSGFEGRARLETWIYAICWRVAANYRRRSRREVASEAEPAAEPAPETPPVKGLHASLGRLDASDRDLLVLHEVGDMSLMALSELTGRSREAIRGRIEHARRALRRRMADAASEIAASHAAPPDVANPETEEQLALRFARGSSDREYVCADYGFSRFGHAVLTRWRGIHDARALALCATVTRAAAAGAPQGFTYLSVVEPSCSPPDADARRLTAWLMGEVAPRMNAIAFVAVSDEHRDLVPQTMNASAFLSGSPINVRYFNEVNAALAWLVQRTPGADLPALSQHCEQLRLRMHALAAGGDMNS